MVDVSSCEENVQPDGKGENRFENIYMVITETEESSSGSMEMRLSQCLEALERCISLKYVPSLSPMFSIFIYCIILLCLLM
jgi:hypothetical protein